MMLVQWIFGLHDFTLHAPGFSLCADTKGELPLH